MSSIPGVSFTTNHFMRIKSYRVNQKQEIGPSITSVVAALGWISFFAVILKPKETLGAVTAFLDLLERILGAVTAFLDLLERIL